MSQKENTVKQKPKKREPWNSFACLAGLARKKEPVILHLNTNTIEDESELKGIIIDADNWTLAFLPMMAGKLLLFRHAVTSIEKLRGK